MRIERFFEIKISDEKAKSKQHPIGRRTKNEWRMASDLLKANQEQKPIGKSSEHWTKYLR